jgi:hypothetical protein
VRIIPKRKKKSRVVSAIYSEFFRNDHEAASVGSVSKVTFQHRQRGYDGKPEEPENPD